MSLLRLTMYNRSGTECPLRVNPAKLVSVVGYDDGTSLVIVHGAKYHVAEGIEEIDGQTAALAVPAEDEM